MEIEDFKNHLQKEYGLPPATFKRLPDDMELLRTIQMVCMDAHLNGMATAAHESIKLINKRFDGVFSINAVRNY